MYYKYIDRNPDKYKAAQFLIDNMKYHYYKGKVININNLLKTWRAQTDSIYYATVKGHTLNDFPWDSLKEPQIITGVRFAPRNADNGINSGDEFELYYWDNGWNYAGSSRAKYEYVEFNNVPKNKLYWIKNRNSGKEELLFVMRNGKRAFLYYEILNEVSN